MNTEAFQIRNYFAIPGMQLKKKITKEGIIFMVCNYFECKKEDICVRNRKLPYVYYRQVLTYLLRHYTAISAYEVGIIIGGYDHATVLNNAGRIAELIDIYPKTKNDILAIKKMISTNPYITKATDKAV